MSRPCLHHAYSYDENFDEQLYLCKLPDEHEGTHEFISADLVTVEVVDAAALAALKEI